MAMQISSKLRNNPSMENVAEEFAHLSTQQLKEIMVAEKIIPFNQPWASREFLHRRIVKHIHTQEAIGGYGRGK